ncbi:glycoside hydrolase family 43 protein [Thermomonas carbonis]|uniref:Glycoside hydrolase family 43 protein n=1 Tax=Thermomonas carbonis TaxID=1463158 RepID=A0A7G9SP20_9GAMM|nr:glycoside hydrolase family 43 protein [Thermomonas carbonis]QNN69595.1 glycoside hydrolase family 43 protein [Thermomonas carbonis]GHB94158.1 xylosidase/arabinosidase [Thermomonas carbonis]
MKTLRCCLAIGVLACSLGAIAGEARFTRIDYSGDDGGAAPNADQYRNPVLAGFYPDPSAIRVGDDFYLVTSTFGYFPGLPVFHSKDLVSWRQIGNAIDRPGQMPYGDAEELTRGLFAATISHHDGTYYIANTCFYCPGKGMGNFVISAKDPAGPWSDPHFLSFDGIDPSLFFDHDGSAWLVSNGIPQVPMRYDGHRAIWLQRYDIATMQLVGERKVLVDGGVDPASKPEHVEGPHIFRRGDWYYLTAAEGGTGEQHAQMVWRSRDVEGPYVAWAGNPSLTQRDLDPNRPSPITSTGHAQFIELKDGSWWTVFLATRPYRGNQYNLGRETFLLPVSWTSDGWPMVLPRGARAPAIATRPALPRDPQTAPMSGPITWSEGFTEKPGPQWLTLHAPQQPWFRTGDGGLRIVPGATALGAHGRAGNGQPTYLAHRLQHHRARIEVMLEPAGLEAGEQAGLALLQNETHHLLAMVERDRNGAALVLRLRAGKDDPLLGRELKRVPLASTHEAVSLRFKLDGPTLDVSWRTQTGEWKSLASGLDTSVLSVDRAGGFIGNTFGPYAVRQ